VLEFASQGALEPSHDDGDAASKISRRVTFINGGLNSKSTLRLCTLANHSFPEQNDYKM
jgi:hypothetical protein